jgi:protein kinase-like protein
MPLAAGTRLGSYEVLAAIGTGGMGEVYRARDLKLNRDVAIKILPSELAGDSERLLRFKREAQVLASLNHPNIAHIHGFDDENAVHALIMELVEGPTLADRIEQGPMAVDEALAIARQIAEALEAAHEQGIVHRDLKPGRGRGVGHHALRFHRRLSRRARASVCQTRRRYRAAPSCERPAQLDRGAEGTRAMTPGRDRANADSLSSRRPLSSPGSAAAAASSADD